MNVLSHGVPFFCDYDLIQRYKGPHDIRPLSAEASVRYAYDPATEDIHAVLTRIGREWKPDLLLCWNPEAYPPPLHIENSPIRTAALVSDWHIFYPFLYENLARYDLVLCDKPGITVFRSPRVSPHCLFPLYSHDTTLHHPSSAAKDYDVVFVGSFNHATHPVRAKYLERLAALSDRHRIGFFTGVYGEDYARLLRRARLVFNYSIRGELNQRVFQTIACGAVPLLEESNTEVRDWFEDRRDIVLFNEHNFEERIAHYLEHLQEAETVAQCALLRTPEFAGESRFDALIEWAANQPSGNRLFRELTPREQAYQAALMYSQTRWPAYQTLGAALIATLLKDTPDDPRAWTLLGNHLLNPYRTSGESGVDEQRYLKAFYRAHQLNASSVPYALNAATAFRFKRNDDAELECLQAALDAGSLHGAELVIGTHACPFWIRWMRAVAEKRTHIATLKAEAHIRVAVLFARNGMLADAENHLAEAAELDAANAAGVRLLAEIYWKTNRQERAVTYLETHLHDMPYALEDRARLSTMLDELGHAGQAHVLREETERMARVCHCGNPSSAT